MKEWLQLHRQDLNAALEDPSAGPRPRSIPNPKQGEPAPSHLDKKPRNRSDEDSRLKKLIKQHSFLRDLEEDPIIEGKHHQKVLEYKAARNRLKNKSRRIKRKTKKTTKHINKNK